MEGEEESEMRTWWAERERGGGSPDGDGPARGGWMEEREKEKRRERWRDGYGLYGERGRVCREVESRERTATGVQTCRVDWCIRVL